MAKHTIAREDIMPMAAYGAERAERRRAVSRVKRHRRLAVGPDATFYFENYDTMWHQVHEMLYIEKGGEDQISDELAAYNPLIPNGTELVATMMIEIDEAERRHRVLASMGGIEASVAIDVDGERIRAVAETDVERTDETGKASSVHFFHFPMTAAQIERFRAPGGRVVVAIDHANYGHMAIMPEEMRLALSEDFD